MAYTPMAMEMAMDEFSTMEALSQRANATPQNRIRMAEPMPVMTPDTASTPGR